MNFDFNLLQHRNAFENDSRRMKLEAKNYKMKDKLKWVLKASGEINVLILAKEVGFRCQGIRKYKRQNASSLNQSLIGNQINQNQQSK